MRRAVPSVAVVALLTLAVATSAGAAVYTVTLTNGSTFDTRYQPQRASWDADKIVLLNEFGNQISFHTADIQSVTVDTETRGFGHQLDDTTMALGWAPNDLLDPDSEEGRAALAAQDAAATREMMMPQVYNQQQFVEPGALSGLPVWMTGVNAVPQLQPPSAGEPVASPPDR
jgi:hypothetical protein